ncbi:hypothetical protein [Algoriphagus terrigena]|nr:hypothetical protein [Algoriphagus terrigena]
MQEQLLSDAMHRPGAVKPPNSPTLIAKACNKYVHYANPSVRNGGGKNG